MERRRQFLEQRGIEADDVAPDPEPPDDEAANSQEAADAEQSAAETVLSGIVNGLTVYEQTTMRLPPGDGSGTRELVKALREEGPKKMPYMQISDEMLSPEGDFLNPVHADGESPINIIHYRNNRNLCHSIQMHCSREVILGNFGPPKRRERGRHASADLMATNRVR